ncbi:MAG: hypothetical protein AAGJ95_16260 [Cyanobacteria bacterium J06554_11]
MQELEYQSRAIANLGQVVWASQGGKDFEREWVNEYALTQKLIQAREEIPKRVAVIFKDLKSSAKVPGWVEQMTDLSMMELAAKP